MSTRQLAELALIAGGGYLVWRAWRDMQGPGGIDTGVYSPPDLAFDWLPDFSFPDLSFPDVSSGPSDGGFPDDGPPAPAAPATPTVGSAGYLAALSRAEDPSQDPYAKNPYSTASGLYQFTRDTWTRLGGDWGSDPSKAFGGLRPSPEEQTAMAARLTSSNASILDRVGVGLSNATLYAAHILGATTARAALPGILAADPSTPLQAFLGPQKVAINPALGKTVGSFLNYVTRKVGG